MKTQNSQKEQNKTKQKTSEEQLSEVKIGNLPKKDFRVTIIKMILWKEWMHNVRSYKKF